MAFNGCNQIIGGLNVFVYDRCDDVNTISNSTWLDADNVKSKSVSIGQNQFDPRL